jgi:hypothetical protein
MSIKLLLLEVTKSNRIILLIFSLGCLASDEDNL